MNQNDPLSELRQRISSALEGLVSKEDIRKQEVIIEITTLLNQKDKDLISELKKYCLTELEMIYQILCSGKCYKFAKEYLSICREYNRDPLLLIPYF